MAGGARGREACSDVRRRAGPLEVLRVAVEAIRRCAFVFPAGVAGLAIESGVSAAENEAGELLMGEFCA